jgi:uncharacterized glyoxalase superfamily protein PhnB
MPISKLKAIKAFVPAQDFELSRRFYLDLGFRQLWGENNACELELDGHSFILQQFYVKDHAGNFMMHMLVENADDWWQHVQELGLKEKYDLCMARPPEMQPWGLRVLYLADPTGVLWHIADKPES